jgi:hypothetical protein
MDFLGFYTVLQLNVPAFDRNVLLPFSGLLNWFKFTVKMEAVHSLEILGYLTTTQCRNPKKTMI